MPDTPPYAFKNPAFLRQALTVPASDHCIDNQRLEFLGDSVLGVLVAERLYLAHPELDEGGLTVWHDALVSTKGIQARLLRLGAWFDEGLTWGQSRYHHPEKAKVDACEAVIGAAWLDGGRPAAEAILARLYTAEDFAAPPAGLVLPARNNGFAEKNPKSLLLEYAQQRKLEKPTYAQRQSGPLHAPTFSVRVRCGGLEAHGEGTSLKKAEAAAAQACLRKIWEMEATHP